MGIAVQILDGVYGHAAANVSVRLERADDGGWAPAASAETGSDGRVENLCEQRLNRGLYRIVFDSDSYFAGLGMSTVYREVMVIFRVRSESDTCRIDIALSPYSYSAHFMTMNSQPVTSSKRRVP